MSESTRPAAPERRVPMGLALITIGILILGFGAAGWLLLQRGVPDGSLPALPPLLARATVPPESAGDAAAPVLLPETPLEGTATARYPSFATAAEAGRAPPPPLDGQPVRLTIPALGVDAPVSAVGLEQVTIDGQVFRQWAVPARYEVGWHQSSALLGRPGNTVINGHNNTLGEVFRDLIDLTEGDEIVVYDGDGPHAFRVAQVLTLPEQGQPAAVRIENAGWIAPTDDERLTLVSCWPYATNSQRLIVVAFPAR